MVLGFQDTSLAVEAQRAPAKAHSSRSSSANGDDAERSRLRLALFDTVGLPESVSDETRLQVEEIFEQIGVVIAWHEPSSVSTGDEADDPYYLKVILFDKEPAAMGHPADAMGIFIGTDFPPDAVWMFDPMIRHALRGSGRKSRPWSSVELGRAYGRVLAHEVIHAIAYDRGHADSGLMAPSQNRHVLTSVATEVDAVSAVAVREGLERLRRIVESAR